MLADMNIVHIPMDQARFAADVLALLGEQQASGHDSLRRRRDVRDRCPIITLDELRATQRDPNFVKSQFLMGREPAVEDLV